MCDSEFTVFILYRRIMTHVIRPTLQLKVHCPTLLLTSGRWCGSRGVLWWWCLHASLRMEQPCATATGLRRDLNYTTFMRWVISF